MIPKKIHYCWFGNNPLPKSVKKCIKSWKKICPDYEIIEWNESNYDVHTNKYMESAYKEKKWGFVPDYARLEIIYKYGGIYLDTDVQVIKKFDDLLKHKSFFGFEDDGKKGFFVALGLGFAAEAGNPLIEKLLDSYKDLSFYKKDGSLNLIPSPQLNSKVFEEYGFLMNNQIQDIDNNLVFPNDYFDPKSYISGNLKITENTYSIHHYDASWLDKQKKEELLLYRKAEKRYRIREKIIHFPNRITKRIIGESRYNRIKKKVKK